MMHFDGIVACICEGSAEQAIMDILKDNSFLIFNELLDDTIIRTRSAKDFESKYLKKGFSDKLTIVRILDSRKENFQLSKLYRDKVSIINIITAPEIEMLIIHSENKYDHFKKLQTKQKMKPSDYCKIQLRYPDVKSYVFVKDYFSDPQKLIYAIKQHKQKSNIPAGEKTLFDLLNMQ